MDATEVNGDWLKSGTSAATGSGTIPWKQIDFHLNMEKHKQPIHRIEHILSGALKARVVPPNRVEKITRDSNDFIWKYRRVNSLPSSMFGRTIHYQRKIQPLGTAKGKRIVEQQPVPGRSADINKSNDSGTERIQQQNMLESYANDRVDSVSPKEPPEENDSNGNLIFKFETEEEQSFDGVVEEDIIQPSVHHLCFGDQSSEATQKAEADSDNSNEGSLNSPVLRSGSVSSISSSSCRETAESNNQSKAAVINEIIKALSTINFEGSADLKPRKPVKQVAMTNESSLSFSVNQTQAASMQTFSCTQYPHNDASSRRDNPYPIGVVKMSKSCNDLNSDSHRSIHPKREVIQQISGPFFKNSHSQTPFRMEPIGVLWEMASHGLPMPLFSEVRIGQKTQIVKEAKGGSLEDNGNEYSSGDSILSRSEPEVKMDEMTNEQKTENNIFNSSEQTVLETRDASRDTQRSRLEQRGIAWDISLNSANPQDHMTLQEAFDVHCSDVKQRSLSRLEKVTQIKMLRYDCDQIFKQYISMLPPFKKDNIEKNTKGYNGNSTQVNPNRFRNRRTKQAKSSKQKIHSNRLAADVYKNRVRREVLAGKTTFPVNKILLC